MEEQHQQGGSEQNPSTEPKKQKGGLGWLWVAALVIVVAVVLFVIQQTQPAEEPAEEQPTEEVEGMMAKDVPLALTDPDAPDLVVEDAIFGFEWEIQAQEETFVSTTAVYYDTVSREGVLGVDVDPDTAGYDDVTTAYKSGEFPVPGQFEDNIKVTADPGETLYLRAYAELAGKHYWSQEVAVPVVTLEEFTNQDK